MIYYPYNYWLLSSYVTFTELLNELVTFYGDHKRMTSHRKTFWNQTKTTCMPIKQHLHTISMNEYHESSYIYILIYWGEKQSEKKHSLIAGQNIYQMMSCPLRMLCPCAYQCSSDKYAAGYCFPFRGVKCCPAQVVFICSLFGRQSAGDV